MKKATLRRLQTGPEGTFGLFNFCGFVCYSLERPDLDNRPNVSCIPVGTYYVVWCHSPKYRRNMYLVDKVKGRNGIRIHSANLASQLLGCIALGERLGKIDGKKAVLISKPMIRKLEEVMDGDTFELEIKNA